MPGRQKRAVDLTSPAARRRLPPRLNAKPHWRFISEGRYLGYRRRQGHSTGTWTVRLYKGGEAYAEHSIGAADDCAAADGERIFDFRSAQEQARLWCDHQERAAQGLEVEEVTRYTVAHCMAEYLEWYAAHRKALEATRLAIEAHIVPALGNHEVRVLTPRLIKKWLQTLAATPPRIRVAAGAPVKWRDLDDGTEGERKRKATANRVLTILKAALNMSFADGRTASDLAWRRVKPFRDVDSPKVVYLEKKSVVRLLAACEPDFRRLVHGGLLTGCRFGELTRLRVGQVKSHPPAVQILKSKNGKSRYVYLNQEGVTFFERLAAGRQASEFLFVRSDGKPWGKSEQSRRMRDACQSAQIEPPVSFHALRHTYASHYLMGGGSLPALATQLGHSDTRMTTRHYAHLAEHWRAEEATRYSPSFGYPLDAPPHPGDMLQYQAVPGGRSSSRTPSTLVPRG